MVECELGHRPRSLGPWPTSNGGIPVLDGFEERRDPSFVVQEYSVNAAQLWLACSVCLDSGGCLLVVGNEVGSQLGDIARRESELQACHWSEYCDLVDCKIQYTKSALPFLGF
jgi:hypothetical protein